MIEDVIFQRLKNYSPLTNLVADRIFPTIPEQDTASTPFLIYSINDASLTFTLGGMTNPCRAEVQIDIWSVNFDDCVSVGKVINDCLNGYRGGNILGSMLINHQSQQEEQGYHIVKIFDVFSNI
jgi:thioredoxin-like negative regulator of GroEL